MTDQTLKDIDRAFKALEERDELLNKISHEIEVNEKYFRENVNTYIADGLLKANKIIDKYKEGAKEQNE